MQKMGVEPTRYCYHTDLNRARLPIPPLLQTIASAIFRGNKAIIANTLKFVNCFLSVLIFLMWNSFPSNPFTKERLFVVEQFLLGLVKIPGLLQILDALFNILRHAQTPSEDEAPHIIRLLILPVHLI